MSDYLSKRGSPYLEATNRHLWRIGTTRLHDAPITVAEDRQIVGAAKWIGVNLEPWWKIEMDLAKARTEEKARAETKASVPAKKKAAAKSKRSAPAKRAVDADRLAYLFREAAERERSKWINTDTGWEYGEDGHILRRYRNGVTITYCDRADVEYGQPVSEEKYCWPCLVAVMKRLRKTIPESERFQGVNGHRGVLWYLSEWYATR